MIEAAAKEEHNPLGDHPSKKAAPERSVAVVDNRIESRDLFATAREIIIGHGDVHYRLRLTSQNKLILTK